MKTKFLKLGAAILCTLMTVFCFVACETQMTDTDTLWENASYREDATVGKGAKAVTVIIEAAEKKMTLTLHTDKSTLGEALFEEKLVNDASYFNTLNGIRADYNEDKAYWAFYDKDGGYMPHGIGDEKISGGESYKFVYTKA